MEASGYVDIFATKGIEYLLVIGFLLALVLFWRLLTRSTPHTAGVGATARPAPWFSLASDRFYHQGHTWAMPEGRDVVRVGMDDFAQKLLGQPQSVDLPRVGESVEQGEKALGVEIGTKSVGLLSPVGGRALDVNEEILRTPRLINEDPYGKGWLFKVSVPRMAPTLKNLLSGKLAWAWMEGTVVSLRGRMAGELGPVMQDGGLPVSGFAKELSPEQWDEIAREFLLTE
jgi:glycine cleavage system H lipoate-binding protein